MQSLYKKPREIQDYYYSALDDQSWRYKKPVFDLADLFDLPEFILSTGYKCHDYFNNVIMDIADSVLTNKYPNIPKTLIQQVVGEYIFVEVHPYSSQYELSNAQCNHIKSYLQNKLNNTNSFPFPKSVCPDWRLIQETQFGIRAFAHDLYQPMLIQHRTRPSSFWDATVGILMQSPTTVYDLPENMCKEFPVSFLLCNPYFTMPREVPKYLGGHRYRLSLFDMFATQQAEAVAARLNSSLLAHNIKILYGDTDLGQTATKLMRRAILGCGGGNDGNMENDFPNRQEWMLHKELFKQTHKHNLTLNYNILMAKVECRKRQQREILIETQQRVLALQKEVAAVTSSG